MTIDELYDRVYYNCEYALQNTFPKPTNPYNIAPIRNKGSKVNNRMGGMNQNPHPMNQNPNLRSGNPRQPPQVQNPIPSPAKPSPFSRAANPPQVKPPTMSHPPTQNSFAQQPNYPGVKPSHPPVHTFNPAQPPKPQMENNQQMAGKMNQEEKDHVQVARPITVSGTMIRTSLLNSLMEFLEDNKHEDLPQKIFEIGDVLYMDDSNFNKTRTVKKLAGMICHSTANFTEIKSTMASVLGNLGYSMEISASENPSFIQGRVANVDGESKAGKITGVFGEISPEVITNFELEYPVIAFEIEFL